MRKVIRRYITIYGRAAIVLMALAFVVAMLVAWSGVYSIAASRGHWPMVALT